MSTRPLTPVQRAAWLDRLAAFELGGVTPLWYLEVDLVDADLPRYVDAWRRLVERHEALRTVLGGDGRHRAVLEPPPWDLPVDDLRALPHDAREAELADLRTRILAAERDPLRWPLFTVRMVRMDDSRTRVFLGVDQFAVDRSGLDLLGADLAALYAGQARPVAEAPDPHVLGSEVLTRSRSYWRDRIGDLPPAPQPPMVSDTHSMTAPAFTRRAHVVAEATWQRLADHAGRAGLDVEAVLSAAFGDALAGWCKEARFTILTAREAPPTDTGPGVPAGQHTALVVTALDNDPRLPFRDRASAVQLQRDRDREYQHVDGADVLDDLRRDAGHPTEALVPVIHSIRLRGTRPPVPEPWALGHGEVVFEVTQQPRTWLRHDVSDHAGPLRLTYDTVDALFPPGLLDGLVAHHVSVLERLAGDPDSWDRPAPGYLPEDQAAVRDRVNDTVTAVPAQLLHDGFWAQAGRTPDAPAVLATDRTLTYRQLRDGAGLLAGRLAEAGVGPGSLVAVIMEKGWHQPLAVMGVLDAGAAYVPIEPDVPAERLLYLLGHSGARVALVQPHLREALPLPPAVTPVVVDEDLLGGPAHPAPRRRQQPGDLAVHHLHLRLDRPAQGRHGHSPWRLNTVWTSTTASP